MTREEIKGLSDRELQEELVWQSRRAANNTKYLFEMFIVLILVTIISGLIIAEKYMLAYEKVIDGF